MSFKKTAQAVLAEPLLKPDDWEKMYGSHAFRGCALDGNHPFCKTASMKKIAESSKYLLSHCTIMSSVAVEEKPLDFLIRPSSVAFVNSNDDAWSSEVLKMSYKTFIGAFSFIEHWQNSAYAKGILIDAVLRKIHLDGAEDPALDWVYYCDILVATDLAHEKLVEDIKSEKVRYLSMGCTTSRVTCTYCGQHVTDSNNYCSHLLYQKGTFLSDEYGVPRRIAELCGGTDMKGGGVVFVEASWVATPAFPGAVKRNIVAEEWIGPKTPYTTAAKTSAFAKAASFQENPADILLGKDFRRDLKR